MNYILDEMTLKRITGCRAGLQIICLNPLKVFFSLSLILRAVIRSFRNLGFLRFLCVILNDFTGEVGITRHPRIRYYCGF